VPDEGAASLGELRAKAAACRACDLWRNATQTVFGEGAERSLAMLVGEQPGDQEDRAGRPFVGPAGALLDSVLSEVGIDRREVYVTNAVKHFKWEPRGKRRIHKRPGLQELAACKPWLKAEIESVKPLIVVCLGATAAQAILGPKTRVTRDRGVLLASEFGLPVLLTVHPASILRSPDQKSREEARGRFTQDMEKVASFLKDKEGVTFQDPNSSEPGDFKPNPADPSRI
jgi:DNA polymerase